MNVALVAQPFDSVLPPDQNSIGLIIFNTAVCLARHADVTIYVPAVSADDRPHEVDGVKIVPVSAAFDRKVEEFISLYPRFFGAAKVLPSRFYYATYITRIALKIRNARHDFVHVLNFPQFARVIGAVAGAATKTSLEMQCDWLTQWDVGEVRPGLDACDFVWGVSSHVTDLIADRFPDMSLRLGTTYNGFQPERFSELSRREPVADVPEVLFVGRVSPEKAVHVIIDAVGKLVGDFPELQLRIVGPRTQLGPEFIVDISDDPLVSELGRFYDGSLAPDYQQYLDRRIAELGITGNVEFTGPIYQEELVKEYLAATMLVNPSFSESFGMTLVEAMATGCPVIGSRVGGMKDIVVEGESGLLVDAGDVDGLARAIRSMLEDSDARAGMARAGQARAVETFSWEARATRIVERFSHEDTRQPA